MGGPSQEQLPPTQQHGSAAHRSISRPARGRVPLDGIDRAGNVVPLQGAPDLIRVERAGTNSFVAPRCSDERGEPLSLRGHRSCLPEQQGPRNAASGSPECGPLQQTWFAVLGQPLPPQAVLGGMPLCAAAHDERAQVRIPSRRLAVRVEGFLPSHESQVTPETRGRSAGLDPRRVPYNMGTRRHQPERHVCGGRRCVAAAATRPAVAVTRPGRARCAVRCCDSPETAREAPSAWTFDKEST